MKRSYITAFVSLLFSCGAFSQASDPVAFLINGEEITKSDFEYIYHKNNSSATLEKKSLKEYVDLFVDFKLKVAQAKDLWYDHSASFKKEYEQYEAQLTLPYLQDTIMREQLLREAYERSGYKLNVSHILVNVPENEKDTSAAYAKINDLYKQLKAGASFEELAKNNSDCPSSKDGGNIGSVTAFTTVYPFENAAFNTPVGKFSEPFRTKFGYHILRVNSKELNVKDKRFSHIMLDGFDKKTEKLANKLCSQLSKGKVKFSDMVKKYSVDEFTNQKNGDLGYLSENVVMPPVITDKVRSINETGVYEIVKSMRGIHIVTVDEVIVNPPFEEMRPELEKKLSRSDRGESDLNTVIDHIKVRNNLVLYRENLQPYYDYTYIREYEKENVEEKKDSIRRLLNEPLFEYKGNTYSQKVFYEPFIAADNKYYPEKNVDKKADAKAFVDMTFEDFIYKYIWQEECNKLKKENPDYRNLLQEYQDGLLLFEISSKKVWTKAAKDIQGLSRYFDEHKADYKWDAPKYKGAVIRCADKATYDKVQKLLADYDRSIANPTKSKKAKGANVAADMSYDSVAVVLNRMFNAENANKVKVTKGLFSKGANADIDAYAFDKTNKYTDVKDFPFVAFSGKLISEPEAFTDVKGPLTADYQNFLEKEWVEDLHSRYPVVIYWAVIDTVKEEK